MKITIIDDSNFLDYKDIISFVHNISYDILKGFHTMISNEKKYNYLLSEELNKLYFDYRSTYSLCESDIEIYLLTGNFAINILMDKPVHGCTVFYENKLICLITWVKDIHILKRVFLHEICHSYRIKKIGINSYGQYIKYLNDQINWLYEEMLAMCTEKSFFPNLSWEDIAGFKYNSGLAKFEKADMYNEISSLEDINKILNKYEHDMDSFIYYLAYYLSKKVSLHKTLSRMMNYSSNDGINIIIKNLKNKA